MKTYPRTAPTLPCRIEPGLFLTPERERTDSVNYQLRTTRAIEYCLNCPIMLACRDRGREMRETGVWGGETDEERAAAGFKPQPYRMAALAAPCGTPAGAKRHRRNGKKPCEACLNAENSAHRERLARKAVAA